MVHGMAVQWPGIMFPVKLKNKKMIKRILFGYTEIKNDNVNFGLLILRLFSGLSFAIVHGLPKIPPSEGFIDGVSNLGFPIPTLFAWLAALSEFLGGFLITLGLATRPAALFAGVTIGVAAFLRHGDDPFSVKEKALLYFFIFLFLFITGSGKYSFDKLINRN